MLKIANPRPPQLASRRQLWLVVAVLLLVFVVQAVASMRQKSVTVDEITYIAAGYYHLRTGDFQMNMTNPPFVKLLAAAPLLILDPNLPAREKPPATWDAIEEWQFAREFLYSNRVDAAQLLFAARLPIVLLGLVLAITVFRWAQELYGNLGGILALSLFTFSPNILAHTRFATQDLALTAFMFMACYFYWRYIKQAGWWLLFLTGVFFGLALVTKSVGILLLPAFSLFFLAKTRVDGLPEPLVAQWQRLMRRLPGQRWLQHLLLLAGQIMLVGVVSVLVINVTYFFQGVLSSLGETLGPALTTRVTAQAAPLKGILELLLSLPVPLPSPYLKSLLFQLTLSSSSGNVYYAGVIYPEGLWYLMPISFLLKTPLPSLILLVIAALLLLVSRDGRIDDLMPVLNVGLVMGLFIYINNVNVGVRYVLPIYPFIFLFIGRLATTKVRQSAALRVLVVLLLMWYVVGTVKIYPHYLTYFNELIGGPENGYLYLADSNIDWGQDLPALKEYMVDQGLEKINLAYFGSADAVYHGITYNYLPSVGLTPNREDEKWWYEIEPNAPPEVVREPGYYAVSANLLISSGWLRPLFGDAYGWLATEEPIDRLGYSIFIYHLE